MKTVPSLSPLFRTGLLVATLALAVGCAKAPDDAQVASDIQTKLSADSGLQNKQLTVQAANGTVTLSGTVDNDAQREAAARYAASSSGSEAGHRQPAGSWDDDGGRGGDCARVCTDVRCGRG